MHSVGGGAAGSRLGPAWYDGPAVHAGRLPRPHSALSSFDFINFLQGPSSMRSTVATLRTLTSSAGWVTGLHPRWQGLYRQRAACNRLPHLVLQPPPCPRAHHRSWFEKFVEAADAVGIPVCLSLAGEQGVVRWQWCRVPFVSCSRLLRAQPSHPSQTPLGTAPSPRVYPPHLQWSTWTPQKPATSASSTQPALGLPAPAVAGAAAAVQALVGLDPRAPAAEGPAAGAPQAPSSDRAVLPQPVKAAAFGCAVFARHVCRKPICSAQTHRGASKLVRAALM